MGVNPEAFGLDPETLEVANEDTIEKRLRSAVRAMLQGRSQEEMLVLAGAVAAAETSHTSFADDAPKTPDELWDYIRDTWHIEISRTQVCEDHDTPFDFFCAGFFEWFPNIFCIGPRGGGKSFDMALLHEMNSRFKPGCESITFGAVEEQSQKVYDDFKNIFLNGGLPEGETETAGEPKIQSTVFKNGSVVKCLPGTVAKVNGPHPPKPHSDEVDLMKAPVWKESRNLASDKVTPDGRRIKAQNYATSTMKYKNGRVDVIRQAFLAAKAKAIAKFGVGDKERVDDLITKTAPFYLFIYCIFEIAQQVPNCRRAPENAAMPETYTAGLPERACKCDCHVIESGKWDDGEPRTLDQVCKGKLYRSRGHRTRSEIIQLFIQNDRLTWEAQQECREAESEGLYIKAFSRKRHGLSSFPLDPSNGPIFTGTDWGFTNPACVLWVQYLERAVPAMDYNGDPKIIPAKSRVVFAEIYIDKATATELGQKAIVREVKLASGWSGGRVPIRRRWADLQGAGDRKDWRKMGLPTAKYSTRSFEEHVKEVRGMFENDRAYVVVDKDELTGMGCPEYADEIEGWREEDGKEVQSANHAMAAGRYVFYGMHDIYGDSGALLDENSPEAKAIAGAKSSGGPGGKAYKRTRPGHSDQPSDEAWRAHV
jgi:hypothetical protein